MNKSQGRKRVKSLIAATLKIMPGLDHATIIAGAMPDVFKFFTKHTK